MSIQLDYEDCSEVAVAEIDRLEDIVFLLSEMLKVLLGSKKYNEEIAPNLMSR